MLYHTTNNFTIPHPNLIKTVVITATLPVKANHCGDLRQRPGGTRPRARSFAMRPSHPAAPSALAARQLPGCTHALARDAHREIRARRACDSRYFLLGSGGVHYPPKKHRRPILFRGVSGNHPTFRGGVYSGNNRNRFPPPFSGHIGTKLCLARGEPRSQLTV